MNQHKKMAQLNTTKEAFGYVFRILSGALNGTEFFLGAHPYFVCLDETDTNSVQLAKNLQATERTLAIPVSAEGEKPGPNFVIHLDNLKDKETFGVTICDVTHTTKQHYAWQQTCRVGEFSFAIKHSDQEWKTDTLGDANTDGPPIIGDIRQEVSSKVSSVTTNAKLKHALLYMQHSVTKMVLLIVLIGLAIAGSVIWTTYTEPDKKIAEINEVLAEIKVPYSLEHGRDDKIYILAYSERDAEWVRRALVKHPEIQKWMIVTANKEIARIGALLERHNIAFFTVRFSDLHEPVLLLSRTRNDTDPVTLQRIQALVQKALPYASTIQIELHDDSKLANLARQGLDRLNLSYVVHPGEQSLTLVSQMVAGDVRLADFNRFANEYYANWGKRYVHFSAELRDDSRKEKSFKYGPGAHVNMTRSHWLFNNLI